MTPAAQLTEQGWHVVILPHENDKGYSNQCAPFWWCRLQGLVLNQDFKRVSSPDGWVYAFSVADSATFFTLKWS